MRIICWWFFASATVAVAQDDAWSLAWSNVGEAAGDAMPLGAVQPAALGWAGASTLAVSAVPSLHGVPGLRSGGIGGILAGGGAGFGAALSTLDAGTAQRLTVRLIVGIALDEAVSVGWGVRIARWSFDRYGSVYDGLLTIGAQIRSDHVTTGVALSALAQEYRPFTAEGLCVAFGSAVRLSEELTVIAEVVDGGTLDVRMGARATIIDEFTVILSWSDGSEVVGAGVDLQLAEWRTVAGARWHPMLGWSHGMELHFTWR
jgi:hypothetical protein